jgi:ribosomal protein L24
MGNSLSKPLNFSVGDKVKILKGKNKGRWGNIVKMGNSFCFVDVRIFTKEVSKGDLIDEFTDSREKVKIDFMEKVEDLVITMPEESQLKPVIDFDKNDASYNKVLMDEVMESLKVDTNEPLDISEVLPTIDEALKLRQTNFHLEDELNKLQNEIVDMKKIKITCNCEEEIIRLKELLSFYISK